MAHARALLAATAIVLSLALLTAQAPPPATQPAARVPGFEQTQNWLRIARTHTFGSFDEPARSVAGWQPLALQRVQDDLQLIRLLIVNAMRLRAGASTDNLFAELRGRRLMFDRLAPLLDLPPDALAGILSTALGAPDSPARRAIAQLMMQAAMLHTDIGMAPPEDLVPAAGVRTTATAIQLRDGRESVVNNLSIHWAIAREAMALVLPATAGTSAARTWYHATIDYLQGDRNYAYLLPHLETARALMPADAGIWLFSGAAYENLAAPVVQVAVDASGSTAKVDEPVILLGRAEQFLRRALSLDPESDEARLRLGRVLELTGRPDQALPLLEQAEARLQRPELRYYAALFVGRGREARTQMEAARSAYERAMALFPQAQSPRLALAHMAWRGGDEGLALSGTRAMFVTARGTGAVDPWWDYDVSLSDGWPEQVADMRRAAAVVAGR